MRGAWIFTLFVALCLPKATASAAPLTRSEKAILQELEIELETLEDVVQQDEWWCEQVDKAVIDDLDQRLGVVELAAATASQRIVDRVYGDFGVAPRFEVIARSHKDCYFRAKGLRGCESAKRTATENPLQAAQRLRDAIDHWHHGGGKLDDSVVLGACEAVQAELLRLPESSWRDREPEDISALLEALSELNSCPSPDHEMVRTVQETRRAVEVLQQADDLLRAGDALRAEILLCEQLHEWPSGGLHPAEEAQPLLQTASSRNEDRLETAFATLEQNTSLEEVVTLHGMLDDLSSRLTSRSQRKEVISAARQRIEEWELSWIATQREELILPDTDQACASIEMKILQIADGLYTDAARLVAEEWLTSVRDHRNYLATLPKPRWPFDQLFPSTEGVVTLNKDALEIYTYLVVEDRRLFACEVVEQYQQRCRDTADSDYLLEKLERETRVDRDLIDLMESWRKRLAGLRFRYPVEGGNSVSYGVGSFVFHAGGGVYKRSLSSWDKAFSTIIEIIEYPVAVGEWSHIRWVQEYSEWYALVVLRGMPEELAIRIERDEGESIFLFWNWEGLAHHKYRQSPNPYSDGYRFVLPRDLRIDFVDQDDNQLWIFP